MSDVVIRSFPIIAQLGRYSAECALCHVQNGQFPLFHVRLLLSGECSPIGVHLDLPSQVRNLLLRILILICFQQTSLHDSILSNYWSIGLGTGRERERERERER